MANVTLRPLEESDLDLLFSWSRIPGIWEYMPTSRKNELLDWNTHYNWWKQPTRTERKRIDLMILYYYPGFPRCVGVIHIDEVKHEIPEIGLYIAYKELWGSGIGREALHETIHLAAAMEIQKLQAFILAKNKRSVRLFRREGFVKTGGKTKYGLDIYQLDLRTAVRSESKLPVAQIGNRLGYQASPG